MRKIILTTVLILLLFSCKKEVEPTSENVMAIINSNEYIVKIDIVAGSVVGSYTDQMIIKVYDSLLTSKSEYHDSSKELNKSQKDSLKNILVKLTKLHNKEKTPLKHGSCMLSDENYTIENDSIKIYIKPEFGNEIYSGIFELIK